MLENTGLDRRQIKKTDTQQKLNTTQNKQTTQNTAEENYHS